MHVFVKLSAVIFVVSLAACARSPATGSTEDLTAAAPV